VVRLTDQLAQILDEADYMKEREVGRLSFPLYFHNSSLTDGIFNTLFPPLSLFFSMAKGRVPRDDRRNEPQCTVVADSPDLHSAFNWYISSQEPQKILPTTKDAILNLSFYYLCLCHGYVLI
jgi:hypothetical protein